VRKKKGATWRPTEGGPLNEAIERGQIQKLHLTQEKVRGPSAEAPNREAPSMNRTKRTVSDADEMPREANDRGQCMFSMGAPAQIGGARLTRWKTLPKDRTYQKKRSLMRMGTLSRQASRIVKVGESIQKKR